ncbi:hypothetical protein [Ornithinicoccus halotolerans]|uniref:hypothetical protein n=1 Tax=Ornithinicoccus halotolerans TaxID=1748220 RepID=UPI00188632DC|nr:hypothetical protein [Ornithinicoccus halotolerans]
MIFLDARYVTGIELPPDGAILDGPTVSAMQDEDGLRVTFEPHLLQRGKPAYARLLCDGRPRCSDARIEIKNVDVKKTPRLPVWRSSLLLGGGVAFLYLGIALLTDFPSNLGNWITYGVATLLTWALLAGGLVMFLRRRELLYFAEGDWLRAPSQTIKRALSEADIKGPTTAP